MLIPHLRLFHVLSRGGCAGWITRIHLREEKTEHTLPILPLKVIQINLVSEILGRRLSLTSSIDRHVTLLSELILSNRAILRNTWHGNTLLLLLLNSVLLSNLFLDLLKCLQEELLYLASLIQDNLRKCPDIPQLLVLHPQVLSCIQDVFSLLLDNGLVLVPDQFLLLLEVGHDLGQTFFEDLDLVLVLVDGLGLIGGP